MKRTPKKTAEKSALPKITVIFSDEGGNSHEPPIGFSGDPIYIDPPYDLPPDGAPLEDALLKESGARYYRYKFARVAGQKPYFNLETVRVFTEKGDMSGYVNFAEYKVPRERISNLQLWVGDAEGEPDIIVQGKNGGKILSLQPLEERESSYPPKVNRKKRYYFPDSRVRIVRWAIVDDAGTVLSDPRMENEIFAAAADDQYYFYVSFAHD